jgi:uncharacterized protein (DUF1919 family)
MNYDTTRIGDIDIEVYYYDSLENAKEKLNELRENIKDSINENEDIEVYKDEELTVDYVNRDYSLRYIYKIIEVQKDVSIEIYSS